MLITAGARGAPASFVCCRPSFCAGLDGLWSSPLPKVAVPNDDAADNPDASSVSESARNPRQHGSALLGGERQQQPVAVAMESDCRTHLRSNRLGQPPRAPYVRENSFPA